MGIAHPKYENCVICSPSCCLKLLQGSTIRVLFAGPVGSVVQIYTDPANIVTGASTKNDALYIYTIYRPNINIYKIFRIKMYIFIQQSFPLQKKKHIKNYSNNNIDFSHFCLQL